MTRNGSDGNRKWVYYRCKKCRINNRQPASEPPPEWPEAPCPKCGKIFKASGSALGAHVEACDGLGGTPQEIRARKRRAKPPLTQAQLQIKRRQRKASYYRHRTAILATRQKRYRSDPAFREDQKARAIMYRGKPENSARLKKRKSDYYWSNPELFRKKANDWYHTFRARCLKRDAARRERTRDQTRANARMEAALLTESYVRNQLSKYSTKSTHEWTEHEVVEKRAIIIASRAKRITVAKAKAIREAYVSGVSAEDLAEQFTISISNVFYILNNKSHYDPHWVLRKIRKPADLTRVMKMIAGSAELSKLYGTEQ